MIRPLLCYRNTRRKNAIISVRSEIEIRGDIRLAGLSRELDEANVNKEILKAIIEKAQNQLINELCGRKYGRNKDAKFKFKRA